MAHAGRIFFAQEPDYVAMREQLDGIVAHLSARTPDVYRHSRRTMGDFVKSFGSIVTRAPQNPPVCRTAIRPRTGVTHTYKPQRANAG